MKTERTGAIVTILILAFVPFFLVVCAAQVQHWDSDIFWALRSGEWIISNWKVPVTDPFSYTFAGHEWVDFTWGFQVIAHLFYTHLGGWTGLFILQVLLSLAIFSLLGLNIVYLSRERVWVLALLMILVLNCAFSRLFIRPHLFGFLFISLYLLILNMNERRRRFGLVFVLLPIQVLWVNIHSSSILGVFIVWAYAGGEFADAFLRVGFGGFPEILRKHKRLLALAVLVPLVTLINPYGLKLALFPFLHQSGLNADALRHIGEWSKISPKILFLFFYPFPRNFFAFKILFYLGIISMVLNLRRLRTRDLMLFGGALFMAISHVRWVGQFAFFAAPIIAFNVSAYLEAHPRVGFRRVKTLGICLAVFMAILTGQLLRDHKFTKNLGLGVPTDVHPVGSVRFMKDAGLRGNIYNNYVFGGYLIHEYPELKVFIDGRTPTVYSPLFFWKSRQVTKKEGWDKVSTEFGITMALVKLDRALCKILHEKADWTPVVFDDVSALYLKKEGVYDEIIEKKGLSFSPCTDKKKVALPEDQEGLRKMKEELKEVLSAIHDGEDGVTFARPHRLLGLVEGGMKDRGHKKRAVAELEKAASARPSGFIYYDLGLALGKAGRYDDAIGTFESAIDLDKGFKKPYMGLGLVYYDKKDYRKAAKWLKKYVVLADDKAEFMGLRTLGMAEFRLGRLIEAEDALKKAAFLAEDSKDRAEVLYNLGNTLFEMGNLDEGVLYYSRALAENQDYKKVYENLARMLEDRKEKDKAEAIRSVLEKNAKRD